MKETVNNQELVSNASSDKTEQEIAKLHDQLSALRSTFSRAYWELVEKSDKYYYLCDVINSNCEPPIISINEETGRKSINLSLGIDIPDDVFKTILAVGLMKTSSDYVDAWRIVKSIIDEACDCCDKVLNLNAKKEIDPVDYLGICKSDYSEEDEESS